MNKDTIAQIDEKDKPYVIPLLNDLENAVREHSFDSGYEIGYDEGWNECLSSY